MIAPLAALGGVLSQLNAWDSAAFSALNSLHSPLWDAVMPRVSSPWVLVPVHLLVLAALLRRRDWRQRSSVFGILLLVIAVDLAGAHLIKDAVQRIRPCQEESLAATIHFIGGHRSGTYGFVSTHTAYAFALAAFARFSLRDRALAFGLLGWAALVGYSRVYLGLHFPGDILGGALWGVAAAGSVPASLAPIQHLVRRHATAPAAHFPGAAPAASPACPAATGPSAVHA